MHMPNFCCNSVLKNKKQQPTSRKSSTRDGKCRQQLSVHEFCFHNMEPLFLSPNKPQETERSYGKVLGESMEEEIGTVQEHNDSRATQYQ